MKIRSFENNQNQEGGAELTVEDFPLGTKVHSTQNHNLGEGEVIEYPHPTKRPRNTVFVRFTNQSDFPLNCMPCNLTKVADQAIVIDFPEAESKRTGTDD